MKRFFVLMPVLLMPIFMVKTTHGFWSDSIDLYRGLSDAVVPGVIAGAGAAYSSDPFSSMVVAAFGAGAVMRLCVGGELKSRHLRRVLCSLGMVTAFTATHFIGSCMRKCAAQKG